MLVRAASRTGNMEAPHRSMSKETPMTSVESDRADQEAFSSSVVLEQTAAAPESLLASPDQLSQAEITQEIIDYHAAADAREAAGETGRDDTARLSAVPLERPAASDQEPEAGRPRDDRAVVAGVRAARRRRDRVRPDAAAHRRAAGRADDGAGPPARLVGPPAREPARSSCGRPTPPVATSTSATSTRRRSTRTSPAPDASSPTTTASTSSRRSSPAPTRGRTT